MADNALTVELSKGSSGTGCGAVDNKIATAASLGALAVTADARTIFVPATYEGTEVLIPVAFNAHGEPIVLTEVLKLAELAHGRAHPRRGGEYTFTAVASLLAWATRFAGPLSAAFLSAPTATLTAGEVEIIIDELDAKSTDGAARALSATLKLRLSDRLAFWLRHVNKQFNAEQFQDFVTRAADELTTADVVTMINNLEIKSEALWKRTVDENGRTKLQIEDQSGPATRIPSTFAFAVPVFDFDDEANGQTFNARLVLKLEKGRPFFTFEVVDFASKMAEVMAALAAQVATVVPQTYMGSPPS